MDNGLVHFYVMKLKLVLIRLNPYCSGQWSRTAIVGSFLSLMGVLILIVVDNGLVQAALKTYLYNTNAVLILIVVDNGLVPTANKSINLK